VEADTGNIGGRFSHEFMVIADSGEDALVFCSTCDYAANIEKAEVARPEKQPADPARLLPLETVNTPDVRTIEEVSAFLHVTPQDIVKTLVFEADGVPVAILMRGDEEVNEAKLRGYLGCDVLELASDVTVLKVTGSPKGFAGPVGIKARTIADYSLLNRINMVTGANKEDFHEKNVNMGRDFTVEEFADLRFVKERDSCPRCGRAIRFARGIEVGHTFKLGTKYSRQMKASFLDKNGEERDMIMGCYGIGIGRTVAACIEQHHDANGIIWPMPIAPYHVILTPVNVKDTRIMEAAEALCSRLAEAGVDVLLDDRDERAGVKFNDADLIGIPLRITIGPKRLSEGRVEVKIRRTGETMAYSLEDAVLFIQRTVRE